MTTFAEWINGLVGLKFKERNGHTVYKITKQTRDLVDFNVPGEVYSTLNQFRYRLEPTGQLTLIGYQDMLIPTEWVN